MSAGETYVLVVSGSAAWASVDVRLDAYPPVYATNSMNRLDVDASGQVTPMDALLVIQTLNGRMSWRGWSADAPRYFLDVHADRQLTPLDALTVINYLNGAVAEGEGESYEAERAPVNAVPQEALAVPVVVIESRASGRVVGDELLEEPAVNRDDASCGSSDPLGIVLESDDPAPLARDRASAPDTDQTSTDLLLDPDFDLDLDDLAQDVARHRQATGERRA